MAFTRFGNIFEENQALVFDVDGTLYHDGRLRRLLLPRLALHMAVSGWDGIRCWRALTGYRRQLEAMRALPPGGCPAGRQLRRTAERTGLPEEFVAAAVARWMEREPLADLARCRRAGLPEFLQAAAGRGLRLAVLSDYPAEAKLRALGVLEFFDVVAWSGDPAIATLKPHPDGLLEVLRRVGVAPERACYIGDRAEVDGETARRAGCRGLLVGRRGAHAVDFFDLAGEDRLKL